MRCRLKNKNMQIPHINSDAFMAYLSASTKITSYKPILQLGKQDTFQAEALFIWQLVYVFDLWITTLKPQRSRTQTKKSKMADREPVFCFELEFTPKLKTLSFFFRTS